MLKKSLAMHCNGHTIIQPKNVHDKANVTLGVTWSSDKTQESGWVGRINKKKVPGEGCPTGPQVLFFSILYCKVHFRLFLFCYKGLNAYSISTARLVQKTKDPWHQSPTILKTFKPLDIHKNTRRTTIVKKYLF